MGYAAKVLKDSINDDGDRLTTFEITFPRIVLAELNTHRALSRCSASSRAVPVERRVAVVLADPFVPESFGKNRPGMQASESLGDVEAARARQAWLDARDAAVIGAQHLAKMEVHKQLPEETVETVQTKMVGGGHWSPFEHVARPAGELETLLGNFRGWVQARKLVRHEDDIVKYLAARGGEK